MHGESRINENRTATRTLVTYGPAILGIENACDDDTSEGSDFVNHCRANERFVDVYEPRTRHVANCIRNNALREGTNDLFEDLDGVDVEPLEDCMAGENGLSPEIALDLDWDSVRYELGVGGPFPGFVQYILVLEEEWEDWETADAMVASAMSDLERDVEATKQFLEATKENWNQQIQQTTAAGPGEPAAIVYSTWR